MPKMKTDIDSSSNTRTLYATSPGRNFQSRQTCSVCGAPVEIPRTSLGERVMNVVCGVVLLAILVPGFWLVEHWAEQQGQHMVNRFPWYERFDDW